MASGVGETEVRGLPVIRDQLEWEERHLQIRAAQLLVSRLDWAQRAFTWLALAFLGVGVAFFAVLCGTVIWWLWTGGPTELPDTVWKLMATTLGGESIFLFIARYWFSQPPLPQSGTRPRAGGQGRTPHDHRARVHGPEVATASLDQNTGATNRPPAVRPP